MMIIIIIKKIVLMIMVIMINFLVINVVKSIKKKNLVELKFFPLFIRSTPQLYGI